MRKKRGRAGRKRAGLLAVFVGILVMVCLIDSQLRPIIKSMAQVQAEAISTRVINQAITDVLAQENVNYDQLVSIEQNEQGRVIAMDTKIVELNRLKAAINIHVQEALMEEDNSIISIPVGSLLGSDFFIGRGPEINIKLKLENNIISNIDYAFESAGINQTLFQINLIITANIYAVIPWYNTSTQVDTNFCLAETIIVGEVPEAFTHITEAPGSDLADQVADYGLEPPSQ